MEKLNTDLIQEILTRLPKTDFKSILQCRKVSQIWQRVLGNPKTGMLFLYFPKYRGPAEFYYRDRQSCEMVNYNLAEEEKQLFYTKVTKIRNMDVTGSKFSLLGSCNGLICYESLKPNHGHVICICNPITGERICLPEVVDSHSTGFGYCHSTNQYKIVSISSVTGNRKCRVQVYTLGDGSGWRDKPEADISYWFLSTGIFANGALHWLAEPGSSRHILAFDLTDETFWFLPSPPCHIPLYSYFNVTLEGDMCLCLPYDIKKGEPMMDIWVFNKKNINNSPSNTCITERTCFNSCPWIKVFSSEWDSDLFHMRQVLSLTETEILLWQNGVFYCYESTTFKELWCAKGAPSSGDIQATPHMNSLVSLKDLGEELVDC